MMNNEKIVKLESLLKVLYASNKRKLLFHGWHHIQFVRSKTKIFAEKIGADCFLAESAALVHDLNYIVLPNSEPSAGNDIRERNLKEAGYSSNEIECIENIMEESHTATRGEKISEEGKALSDADTLFKVVPLTSIMLSGSYIVENKVDIEFLANKICSEQAPLMEKGIYFYTPLAKELYSGWAQIHLDLWQSVGKSLEDPDIKRLLNDLEGKL